MVGYSFESKAYSKYNPAERKILKGRDVRFIDSCGNAAAESDYVIVKLSPHQEYPGIPPAIKDEGIDSDDDEDVVFDDAIGEADCEDVVEVADIDDDNKNEVVCDDPGSSGGRDGAIGGMDGASCGRDGASGAIDGAIGDSDDASGVRDGTSGGSGSIGSEKGERQGS